MRHDDRMNETEGKTLAQGQGMNVPGETETREEAEMSREKGQDAEEKEAAPEAPQEDAAFDRQLEEMMNGTGGKKAGEEKARKKEVSPGGGGPGSPGHWSRKGPGRQRAQSSHSSYGDAGEKGDPEPAFGQRSGFRHRQCGRGIQSPCRGAGDPCKGRR